MSTSIVITPYTESQLQNAKAQIIYNYNNRGDEWHRYTWEVHHRHPGAMLVSENLWERVFGSFVPHPNSPDPKIVEREKQRKLRALGDSPQDVASLEYWQHQVKVQSIANGDDVYEGERGTPEHFEWVRLQHLDEILKAMEQRDAWIVAQVRAKSYGLRDAAEIERIFSEIAELEARQLSVREDFARRNAKARPPADDEVMEEPAAEAASAEKAPEAAA